MLFVWNKPDLSALLNTIAQGHSLYWMLATSTGVECDEWAFQPGAAVENSQSRYVGFMVRRGRDSKARERARYRFELLSHSGDPDILRLSELVVNGRPALFINFPYEYALLEADTEELRTNGRRVPAGLVAYDPRELERWILSRTSCLTARDAINQELARDGFRATQLGIHAQRPEVGF